MDSIQNFLFIFQIFLSILIILFVVLQQSDEDSLSGIGGNATNAKMLSKRTLGSPISKITMIIFILFMSNSLLLATFSARQFNKKSSSIREYVEEQKEENKKEIKEENK